LPPNSPLTADESMSVLLNTTMNEQPIDYTPEFFWCILLPSGLSLTVSLFVLLNFFVLNRHLQSFIYHQISTFFALCDVVSALARLLEAPLFLGTEHCLLREHVFLAASFMKVVAVMFNSCLIYYVLHTSSVPSIKAIQLVVLVTSLACVVNIFCMAFYNSANLMCYDSDPVSFSPNHVSHSEFTAFLLTYIAPICLSFIVIIALLIMTYVRLHTVFNAALRHLLYRLLPYPIIFCLAFLPSFFFQLVYMTANGKRLTFLKWLGLVGSNISGALFGLFYLYIHISEVKSSSEPSKHKVNNGAGSADTRGEHIRHSHVSWTLKSSRSNPSSTMRSETIASERELSRVREGDDRGSVTYMTFFSRRISRAASDGTEALTFSGKDTSDGPKDTRRNSKERSRAGTQTKFSITSSEV